MLMDHFDIELWDIISLVKPPLRLGLDDQQNVYKDFSNKGIFLQILPYSLTKQMVV